MPASAKRVPEERALTISQSAALRTQRGLHVAQLAAAVALGMGQRTDQAAVDDLGHPVGTQCGAARQRAAEQQHAGNVWRQHQAAAELFHQQRGGQRPAAQAPERFIEGQAQPAHLRHLLPVFAAEAVGACGDAAALLEAVLLAHPARHAVAQQHIVVVQVEIHVAPLTGRARPWP
jgi:hypothetical protein